MLSVRNRKVLSGVACRFVLESLLLLVVVSSLVVVVVIFDLFLTYVVVVEARCSLPCISRHAFLPT